MDWKKKLGSRKFWSLLAVFVTALLVMFNLDSVTIEGNGHDHCRWCSSGILVKEHYANK